jgi:hypothetical protein
LDDVGGRGARRESVGFDPDRLNRLDDAMRAALVEPTR